MDEVADKADVVMPKRRWYQFSLGWLWLVVALLAVSMLFVPYGTQVSPALQIKVVGPDVKGMPGLVAKWGGGFYG